MSQDLSKLEHDSSLEAIVGLSIESWRFAKIFIRVLAKLDAGEKKRYEGQLRWFIKSIETKLEAVGLKLVNVEGIPFDAGIAARAVNMEDFGEEDTLIVDQMLEPIIMGPNGVVKEGTIILRRINQ